MLKHTVRRAEMPLTAQLFSEIGFNTNLCITVVASLIAVLFVSIAKEKGRDVARCLSESKWYVQFPLMLAGFLLLIFCVYANTGYVPIAYVYENV